MPRRQEEEEDEGIFGDLYEMLLLTPFWVGPLAAGIAYALFAWVFPRFFAPAPPGQVDTTFILRDLFPMLAPWVTGFVLLLWILAESKKLIRRATAKSATSTGSASPPPNRSAPPANCAAPPSPSCPVCGSATVLRTAQRGPHAGQSFYGCSRYPQCKGMVK